VSRWTVYVEGEREVRKSLQAAGLSVTNLTKVHRVVTKQALRDLKAASPIETGALRRSGKGRATSKVAEAKFSTPYVLKQEFRPHGKKSRRGSGWYYGPEAKRSHERWMDTYWRELTDMLDRAFGS
jgi:hypothetical protein